LVIDRSSASVTVPTRSSSKAALGERALNLGETWDRWV